MRKQAKAGQTLRSPVAQFDLNSITSIREAKADINYLLNSSRTKKYPKYLAWGQNRQESAITSWDETNEWPLEPLLSLSLFLALAPHYHFNCQDLSKVATVIRKFVNRSLSWHLQWSYLILVLPLGHFVLSLYTCLDLFLSASLSLFLLPRRTSNCTSLISV